MPTIYTNLVLSYRAWHWRMTTERLERSSPAFGLSVLHGLNVYSLLFLLPPDSMPAWLFVALPFAGGLLAFRLVGRIYRAHAAAAAYAKDLRAAVPSVREFPLVYAYLLCTFMLFFGSIFVAARGAA